MSVRNSHARAFAVALGVALATACPRSQDKPEPGIAPEALAQKGLTDHAIAAWRYRIKAAPQDAKLRAALVDFLLEKEYTNDALDEAQAAMTAIPRNYELVIRMARACQRKAEALAVANGGRTSAMSWFTDVKRWANSAAKLAPGKREPYAMSGMASFSLGQIDKAKRDADKLIDIAPDHPGGWILRGECLFVDYQSAQKKKNKKRARELAETVHATFTRAIKCDDKRVIPWRRRGDLYAWEQKRKDALAAWTEALARDPMRGAPRDWLRENVDTKKRLELYRAALARFDAVGTKPVSKKARLLWLLGVLEYEAQDFENARKHMQACYDLRNDWPNALFYHGLSSWKLDDEDMALLAFGLFAQKDAVQLARAIRETKASADVNKQLVKYFADLAFKRGNAPMSRDLNHTVALLEDDALRWNNYAFLCRETSQYEKSWGAYKKALGHAPDDPQLLNDAAVILHYHLNRDLDEAEQMYTQAMKNADARLAKGQQLSDKDRKRFRQAKIDAGNNLTHLRKARKAMAEAARDAAKKNKKKSKKD